MVLGTFESEFDDEDD
jgi:hypothetical protein